jgi:hypothetical protein
MVTVLIAVLAAVAVICAGLVAIPLWSALVQSWQFQPVVQECIALKDAAARQACYEFSNREARHPARGAQVPIILRSSDDISR